MSKFDEEVSQKLKQLMDEQKVASNWAAAQQDRLEVATQQLTSSMKARIEGEWLMVSMKPAAKDLQRIAHFTAEVRHRKSKALLGAAYIVEVGDVANERFDDPESEDGYSAPIISAFFFAPSSDHIDCEPAALTDTSYGLPDFHLRENAFIDWLAPQLVSMTANLEQRRRTMD